MTDNLTSAVRKAAAKEHGYLEDSKIEMENIQEGSEEAVQAMVEAAKSTAELESNIALMGTMNLALEQINRLAAQKQMEFSAHVKARNMMLGVVRDLLPGTVRKKTIRELTEEIWVNCSDYWLSSALIAVAAWIRNERPVCESAVRSAIQTDAPKSALFFCLMNLRVDRSEAAAAWLEYFLACQNPQTMQPESAILLQAFLAGLFGNSPDLQTRVEDIVHGWQDQIGQDHLAAQSITAAYRNYLIFLPSPSAEPLRTLRECSPDYDEIDARRKEFGRFEQMTEIIGQLRDREETEDIEEQRRMADRVLDRLLYEMVPEERDMQRQIDFYELVCKHKGDRAKAEAEQYSSVRYMDPDIGNEVSDSADAASKPGNKVSSTGNEPPRTGNESSKPGNKSSGDENTSWEREDEMTIPPEDGRPFAIGVRMARWALDDSDTASPTVRRYAMHHTAPWLLEAAHDLYEQNRRSVNAGLPRIRLRIENWKGQTDGHDLEDLSTDMRTWFERRKRQIQIFNARNMTALILLVLSLILTLTTPYALAGTAACALYLAYRIINGLRGFDTMVERSLQTLENAVDEAATFYDEADAEKDQLRIMEEELAEL